MCAAEVRAMARDRASARGISGSETVSSVRAPPRCAVNQGTECRHPVVLRGGVTPSSTTSEPPCPEAGSPTLAKSSLGWSARPGSETSSVRIQPVCTTSSRHPQKAGNFPGNDAGVQVRRLIWGGIRHSGNAWRRAHCHRPSQTSNRRAAPARRTSRGELAPQLPVRGSLLRVAGRMMHAHRPPALGGSGSGGVPTLLTRSPRPMRSRRPRSSSERGGGCTRRPAS